MYLRAAKAELEEAGESTEGMATSVSKLRESILALTKGQVDIMLDENTFKSTYQIFKELSQVWEDMADVDQAALLELIGGKRNSDAVMSLISNFEIAEQALLTANNSAGSAMAENEKRMASIQGRITEFTRSFEEFSAKVLDGNLVKGVVDFGSSVLDVLTDIVETFGTLPPLISTVVGMFTAVQGIHGKDFGLFSAVMGEDGVKRVGILGNSISDLTTRFHQAQEAGMSFGQSLKMAFNVDFGRSIADITKYNDAIKVSAEEGVNFIGTLKDSDLAMREYLNSLDGGQASFAGFQEFCKKSGNEVQNLGLKSKVAAVGVQLLNTALNMVISFPFPPGGDWNPLSLFPLFCFHKFHYTGFWACLQAYF